MFKWFKKNINFHRKRYSIGKKILADEVFNRVKQKTILEIEKRPRRTEIINYFISLTEGENYLEIGTRNPKKNFDKIVCKNKYSVDPGIEFEENPVTYQFTSDMFFKKLKNNQLDIKTTVKFDIIFIDGLHISTQVEKDIINSLQFIKENGFIILHDCNPPSEYHQREDYAFTNSPAGSFWNGTTWKAFYKYRHHPNLYSICFDNDWGVGVMSKSKLKGFNQLADTIENEFYEYEDFNLNRLKHLNLQSFEEWKKRF